MVQMALQQQSLHSPMDTDTPVAQTSSSPAEAAMNFAASFYRDTQACRSEVSGHSCYAIYRDKILAIDKFAANVAAAFLPLLRTGGGLSGADSELWGDFDRLAQRGKNLRDRESQHLQHQSAIIATWGLECFRYYGWHVLPLPLRPSAT